MIELINELRKIDEELRDSTRYTSDYVYGWTLTELLKNFKKVENAWCGSWFGYLANVYCTDFDSPTFDMHRSLDVERGTESDREPQKESNWCRYSDEQVDLAIEQGVERSDIRNTFDHSLQWADRFRDKKADVLDIIKIVQMNHTSIFDSLANSVEDLHIQSPDDIVERQKRAVLESKDPVANQFAIRIPPHIRYRAKITWSMDAASTVRELRKLIAGIVRQIERVIGTNKFPLATGKKVFIGHGRDKSWLELKIFIEGKLKLPVTAYEVETGHGYPVYDNVMSCIGEAGIAFLVMTGEDKVVDIDVKERLHPRLNVVHELGICQATLPQGRAIALVENGCTVPSNIVGFDQIQFEKGNIMSATEKIRDVLAREKFLD